MANRVHRQVVAFVKQFGVDIHMLQLSHANERSVHRLMGHNTRTEPRRCHFGVMPTVSDESVAEYESCYNASLGNAQSLMAALSADSKLKNHLHENLADRNSISHATINEKENGILTKQQACHSDVKAFSHPSSDSDFFEDVKVTDDAGEPLMPRSLLDQAVENFMLKDNDQGRLLWRRFKKATEMGSVFTCDSVITTWVGEGNVASRPVLIYSVLAFRSWKKNKRALELLNWILTKKPFEILDIDHAINIDLLCKAEGFKKAVEYFKQIRKTSQNSLMIYSGFLAAYLEHDMEENAKRLLLQARSLRLPEQTFFFNQFLVFYKAKGRMRDVADLLKEMEGHGVDADLNTYNIILDVRARKGDVSGMQSLWSYLEEETSIKPNAVSYALLSKCYMAVGLFDRATTALKKLESSPFSNKRAVYRWLLKLYALLKRDDHLERVWGMLKPVSKSLVDDYSIMVDSLGKAGKVNRAEEIFKEGLNAFGIKRLHQYHAIINVFLNHEMFQKAEDLVDELTKHAFKPGSSSYHQLIEVYAKKGDERKAMETLRKAQEASKFFSGRKPWYASYLTILEMFGDKGDVAQAEQVMQELKGTGYSCSFRMYSALLKAYVKAKIMPNGFLDRMRADGAIPNSHIRKELEKLMDNRRELYEVCGAKRYLY